VVTRAVSRYHTRMRSGSAGLLLLVLGLGACAGPRTLPPSRVTDAPWRDVPTDQLAFQAREDVERGDPRAALAKLEQVLAADPRHVDALRLRQDVLRERGRRGLLLREARAAVEARPDDGIAHYLLARVERDTERKLAAFERAAQLAPASLWPWLGLAHTLRGRDKERALRIYHDLYAASGGHPLVGVAWAATLRENGRLDEATAIYTALRADARVRGTAELGLAQIALARDDRRAAWGPLLEALRRRPFDPGVQGLVVGWLESGAPDDQVAWFVDVLREDPARMAAFARDAGAVPLAALLQRSGQLQALRTLLEQAATQRHPALRRAYRRLLLAFGDVPAFLSVARADVPLHVVDVEPNLVRGRWLGLLRGPWHDGDALASPAQSVDLLAALRDVGWLHEAELLAEVVLRRWPAASSSVLAVRDEVRRELAFEAGVRRVIYTGYQEQDPAALVDVLARLRELSLRVLGTDVVGTPPRFAAPLVGEMIDPLAGPLAAHFDRYNRYFVLGRRTAGVAEGLLMTRLSVQELPDSEELALPARCHEVVGIDRDVRSLSGVLGGDLAGVALLNHFLIDHDAVREWSRGIATRRRIAAEDALALQRDPLPDHTGADPLDVAWRLETMSPLEDTALDAAVLDTIRHHERQHLVDAFWFLPVEHNLWRALGLVFEFAFSPSAIEAEMERRAELASLAVSPHTELVLAHVADFASEPDLRSPHHQGFGELARQLAAALVARGVDPAAALPARWHTVPMVTVREAARALLGGLR
jgi:tetratricopeptide (TPR) repeat protein